VVGIHPSPALPTKAQVLSHGLDNITHQEGDGKSLRFEGGTFDVVVLHTLLTHVPDPEKILADASRVLKPRGALAICDSDFSTVTLQTGPGDPLQVCTEAFVENFVHDKSLVRRMSALTQAAGFEVYSKLRSHRDDLSGPVPMPWPRKDEEVRISPMPLRRKGADARKQVTFSVTWPMVRW
jgi:ubiquinone/menaquinone biosynthesis C-methylase UbiE